MSYAAPSCMLPCHMPPYDMDLRSMTHRSEGHSMHGAMTWVCPPVRVGGPHGCTYPIASQYVGSAHKTAEQVMRAKWVWGLHRTRQRHSKEYGRRGRRADQGRGRCRVVAIHQYAPVCGVCGVCVVNIEWYRCVNILLSPTHTTTIVISSTCRPPSTTAHDRAPQASREALCVALSTRTTNINPPRIFSAYQKGFSLSTIPYMPRVWLSRMRCM